MPLTFITGPVRSGKSRFALRLANDGPAPVVFLATAHTYAGDHEWSARLAHHRAERPREWGTVEAASLSQDELLSYIASRPVATTLLVDAVGTYIAARIDDHLAIAGDAAPALEEAVERDTSALVTALLACRANTIVVGEQVGWDVVAQSSAARMFRDIAGRAHARLATQADRAYLIVSGFSLDLHSLGMPI